ncbi:hypothetical protein PYCCODRAFT_10996 [Trametes coccinea BRFM310]|uniref:Uncharacterized protein n=1 Tax=Trametes coccinea (strain BRFM310) TaxID=1353009 RepID=A0A1Y2J7V8_TRAC3|nr:hypothetical protein PYCCODRAFT_10996 [Trametes coccinea BRFM310]
MARSNGSRRMRRGARKGYALKNAPHRTSGMPFIPFVYAECTQCCHSKAFRPPCPFLSPHAQQACSQRTSTLPYDAPPSSAPGGRSDRRSPSPAWAMHGVRRRPPGARRVAGVGIEIGALFYSGARLRERCICTVLWKGRECAIGRYAIRSFLCARGASGCGAWCASFVARS